MITSAAERIRGLASLFWREVLKFGAVGGVAFIIDSALYIWLFTGPMNDSEVKAKVIASIVATCFSWVANRYWTFRHRRQANVLRELILFLIMNGIGLAIAAGCVAFAKYVLGLTDKPSLFIAGSVVGLVLGTIFRFFAYRFWVFTAELDQEPQFAHDHELIERHHHEHRAAAGVGSPAAGAAAGSAAGPAAPTRPDDSYSSEERPTAGT